MYSSFLIMQKTSLYILLDALIVCAIFLFALKYYKTGFVGAISKSCVNIYSLAFALFFSISVFNLLDNVFNLSNTLNTHIKDLVTSVYGLNLYNAPLAQINKKYLTKLGYSAWFVLPYEVAQNAVNFGEHITQMYFSKVLTFIIGCVLFLIVKVILNSFCNALTPKLKNSYLGVYNNVLGGFYGIIIFLLC